MSIGQSAATAVSTGNLAALKYVFDFLHKLGIQARIVRLRTREMLFDKRDGDDPFLLMYVPFHSTPDWPKKGFDV